MFKNTLLILLFIISNTVNSQNKITVGANRTKEYIGLIKNKSIGIIANQTSVIFHESGNTHLVDSLLDLNINVTKVFAPEHGFRGAKDAGEKVDSEVDKKTGLKIISLYGNNKKPTSEQIKDLDFLIFDIQDVGARFYTYISTLHYVMESCAENHIPLIILDRPNPNGDYVDGPILKNRYKSFVGMHNVPIVHGMTIAEYALMINGEGWLANKLTCELIIVKNKNYTHSSIYELPIPPSPNLPNYRAIRLYPSLCLFEGTNVSVGRGTNKQFQVYGSPYLNKNTNNYSFTPKSNFGAKYPKHENKECIGENLDSEDLTTQKLNLTYLIKAYKNTNKKEEFFNSFFYKLVGNEDLKSKIIKGTDISVIENEWSPGLKKYKVIREKYLLYK